MPFCKNKNVDITFRKGRYKVRNMVKRKENELRERKELEKTNEDGDQCGNPIRHNSALDIKRGRLSKETANIDNAQQERSSALPWTDGWANRLAHSQIRKRVYTHAHTPG